MLHGGCCCHQHGFQEHSTLQARSRHCVYSHSAARRHCAATEVGGTFVWRCVAAVACALGGMCQFGSGPPQGFLSWADTPNAIVCRCVPKRTHPLVMFVSSAVSVTVDDVAITPTAGGFFFSRMHAHVVWAGTHVSTSLPAGLLMCCMCICARRVPPLKAD
jgi:hypothetical protein